MRKKGPWGLNFSNALFEGLIWGGAYVRRGLFTLGNLRCKINRVKLKVGTQIKKEIIFRTVLALFCLYFRALSKYKVPVTYIRSGDVTEGFWVFAQRVGGGGEGVYFRNFTIVKLRPDRRRQRE